MYKKALTPRLMRTHAEVPRMVVEAKNKFPIVFVHGAMGWGEDDLWNKFMRYYGFVRMDIPRMCRTIGLEAVAPSLGPYVPCWDRACDLWAQLVGGTVDYGEVHSKRYKHDRYGRTYDKPLIPDWGELDDEGKRKKICLIGHSFGAPAVRVFMSILAEGSAEEREATPESELSEFFKGGKADWVHAITTFAGVNNGLTLVEIFGEDVCAPLWSGLHFLISLIMDIPIARVIYDMKFDQYHLTSKPGGIYTPIWEKWRGARNMAQKQLNSMVHEVTFPGSAELTAEYPGPYPNVYYFCYAGAATEYNDKGYAVTRREMFSPTRVVGPITGRLKMKPNDRSPGFDESWRQSDTLVSVKTAQNPLSEPAEDYVSMDECRPGVWYKMPLESKDHLAYMGVGEENEIYGAFMLSVITRMLNLPTADGNDVHLK